MPAEKVSIQEALRLQDQINKPTPLAPEEIRDYAVAGLLVLRGMSRGEKLRVIARMRVMVK